MRCSAPGCTSSSASRTKASADRCGGRSSGASTRTTRMDRSSGCARPRAACASGAITTRRGGARPTIARARSRSLMAQLKAFADLIAKPIKRDDKLSVSVAPARQHQPGPRAAAAHGRRHGARRHLGRMGGGARRARRESRFRAIRRRAPGGAFAIGVTRDQALAAHADLLQALRAFREHGRRRSRGAAARGDA